jgi:predicted transcriptional regulator
MKKATKSRVRSVMESRGRVSLAEWIAAGHTQTELARILGYSQPLIAQWLDGTARPAAADREVLERLGICAAEDWLTPSERVRVNDIAAKAG